MKEKTSKMVVWQAYFPPPPPDVCLAEGDKIEQLTKAKEIIKDLLDTQYQLASCLEVFQDRIRRAEDFISSVGVTK